VIYAKAETAQEIASLLRMMDSEEKIQAKIVADRLLGKSKKCDDEKGIIINAPRRSGKTTELLKYAEEKNPYGQFAVVCSNFDRQQQIIKIHLEIFNKITQASKVADRLLGNPITGRAVNPPLMISPGSFYLLRGSCRPVYVDELGEISNEDTMKYVLDTGRFVAAVTS